MANISFEDYTRIERATATGVSEAALEAIAQALQLEEAEHSHLWSLVRTRPRAALWTPLLGLPTGALAGRRHQIVTKPVTIEVAVTKPLAASP